MDDTKQNGGADVTPENTGADNVTETKKSFDELLQDKEYQSAFDKKIAQSLQTAKAKWKEELEAEKTEAEKLAKMKSDEKLQYQLEKSNEEKDNALAELNAYKLKEEAIKVAGEKGLDISLLNYLNFKTLKAEEVNSKIDEISAAFNKAVEKAVNEKLREDSPTSKLGDTTTKKQRVSRSSY